MTDHDKTEADDGHVDEHIELEDLDARDEAKGGVWGDPHVSEKDSVARIAELEPAKIEIPN